MTNSIPILLASFIIPLSLTAGIIALLQRPAHRWGLVDRPGGRKQHDGATPLVGGIGMALGFAVALAGGSINSTHWNLLAGLAMLVSLGVVDDLRDLPAKKKLLWQICAVAIIIVPQALYLQHLGTIEPFGRIQLGLLVAIPFTIFAVVGLINAINMSDGIDGLAGSMTAISVFWFGVTAWLAGHQTRMLELAMLCGASGGFLVFNLRTPWRSKAAVFMGDAGSMMLGACLGWFSIKISQGIQATPASAPPIVVLWILGLPVFDTLVLMLRRIRQGRSPLSAGRDHMHHIWLHAGFTPGQTTVLLGGFHFLLGAFAIITWQLGVPQWVLFVCYVAMFFSHRYMQQHAWSVSKWLRYLGRWAKN